MAVPTDIEARGCSAHLAQPVGDEGLMEATALVYAMRLHNAPGVVFRSSYNEVDICRHVFRWSSLEPEQVFINGFQADAQGHTPDSTYYSLREYVNNAGPPMEPHRDRYIFVSTTLSSAYVPQTISHRNREVWRYEIYAPGGIWVAQTLANYGYPAQNEVAFVRGINRQYIRSAQRFRLVDSAGRLTRVRVDQSLVINPYFDPASHPERRLITIDNAVDYCMIDGSRVPLNITYIDPQPREKRDVSTPDTSKNPSGTAIWYGQKVTNTDSNINAGFRSSFTYEAYLFMRNEYISIDYAPGTRSDKILSGPRLIRDGFPSLADTPFAEHGLDCSFGSDDSNEAYIFTGNLCARINFGPHGYDDRIIKGPVTIAEMFPFFKNTGFENGVDAAFESSAEYEAYIFKGDRYSRINYKQPRLIGGPTKIADGYHSLGGTIFESGIEAAFASHTRNEAYIFKGDQYALINFSPGDTDDYIIHGPDKTTPAWPSLATVLPHKNHGLE